MDAPPAQPGGPTGAETGALLAWAQVVVDVRSPGEYAEGHIQGALNFPLFDNIERAEVGTLYKHLGKQVALSRGYELVGGKLPGLMAQFEAFRGQRLLIYCARGGMRSGAITALLDSLKFNVRRIPGGYKAFRNHLLARVDALVPPRIIVIHGRTGVGKTRVLLRLPNHLDLEGLAQHRSSLFGAVGKHPRTQQNFEAHLLSALEGLDLAQPVFIEGESRKVGSAIIPPKLFAAMKAATCVLLEAGLDTRIARTIAEYHQDDPETRLQLERALTNLTPLLGKVRVGELLVLLRAGDLRGVVGPLLTEYYDPRYLHAMRDYTYARTLSSQDEGQAARDLAAFAQGL